MQKTEKAFEDRKDVLKNYHYAKRINKANWSSWGTAFTNIQRVFRETLKYVYCSSNWQHETGQQSTAIHLGEADCEDGMGAAAEVIHRCAGCGAVGIAENDQVLHVTVVVNQVLGQIYT